MTSLLMVLAGSSFAINAASLLGFAEYLRRRGHVRAFGIVAFLAAFGILIGLIVALAGLVEVFAGGPTR